MQRTIVLLYTINDQKENEKIFKLPLAKDKKFKYFKVNLKIYKTSTLKTIKGGKS